MAFSSPDCSKKFEQSISFWNNKYSFKEKTPNLPVGLALSIVMWETEFSYFEKINPKSKQNQKTKPTPTKN